MKYLVDKNNDSGLSGLGAFGQGDAATLYPGQQLTPNTSITSDNGVFTFGMGGDGNLWVVDNIRGIVLRSFNTANRGVVRAVMQGDGNFVAYDSKNNPIWNSGAKGAGAYIVIQTDGNLVMYLNGAVKWQSKTDQPSDLVASEVKAIQRAKLPAFSATTLSQWKEAQEAGILSQADIAGLQAFEAGLPAEIALQAGVLKNIIDRIMIQVDHDKKPIPEYWAIPQLVRDSADRIYSSILPGIDFSNVQTGRGFWSKEQTQAIIYKVIDNYINAINSIDLSKFGIPSKKIILHYLLYPYAYFMTQTVNLGPFAAAGHSDNNNWGAFQWNYDPAQTILDKINPIIQKLGFTNMYNNFSNIFAWLGGTTGGKNTGGKYPTETGYRKLADEVYRAIGDKKAKSSVFINQVGEFFNQMETEFWHGLIMPTIGLTLLAIELGGFQEVTFTIDLIFGTHTTKDIYHFIGGMLSGTPLLGKWMQNLVNAIGDTLDKWAKEVHTAIANLFSAGDLNKVRDETEYAQLTYLTDNELVNLEKQHGMVTMIMNDWSSDSRDDLKQNFIQNLQSRGTTSSNKILASLKIIDGAA